MLKKLFQTFLKQKQDTHLCSDRQKKLSKHSLSSAPVPQKASASMSQREAQRPMASTAHATQSSMTGACVHVSETCWAAVQVRHSISSDSKL